MADSKIERGFTAAALAPLRGRYARNIVEREILRVVATVPASDDGDILPAARREVLKWASKRSGGELPESAWGGTAFELLAAGRTTMAAVVTTERGTVWALRGDDPDKVVPGRIWSTEVSLGQSAGESDVLLSVRLLVNSSESDIVVEPAVPGLVLQIADKCGLKDGTIPIWPLPHYASTEEHADTLIGWLSDRSRRLPIIVASGDERSGVPDKPLVDVETLAKALCGLAHVVSVPASLTYKLSDELGKALTVFHGGLRTYGPGFDLLADPRDHRLYLGSVLNLHAAAVETELRANTAQESLRRTRLGHDVLPFAGVRSASLRIEQTLRIAEGATESEQLNSANARNEALELEVKGLQAEVDQALDLSVQEAERAEAAEKQLASSWSRIEQLEIALKASGVANDDQNDQPDVWADFVDWCDRRMSGSLSLTPSARRGLRNPDFEDLELATKCVAWLATEARDRFLGGGGALANIPVFEGVTNAPCGADEYQFDFQGRRLVANWHLKNGGNTRQPERCLRIYYAFDEVSRQIVISDMPAHRKTGAS